MFFFASCSEGGEKTGSSSKPSQYPLLGFKDRHLEDEYLKYLVVASKWRIILGYVTAILLYASVPFATTWPSYDDLIWNEELYRILSDEQKEDYTENVLPEGFWSAFETMSTSTVYAFFCLVLVIFILGGFVANLHWTQ